MTRKRKGIKKLIFTYSLHIWGIFLLVNVIVFYTSHFMLIASGCMTTQQVAQDSRCLYILSGKIYQQGTKGSPHKGHPCGTDVTSVVPASHLGAITTYLVPNHVADVCAAAQVPTATPLPTIDPAPLPAQASQPTAIPTDMPAPTSTQDRQAPTSTVIPTLAPAVTSPPVPTISPTSQAGTTILDLTIFLHGIGKAGDAVNTLSSGTQNPVSTASDISVELLNSANVPSAEVTGKIVYNHAEGNFRGTVEFDPTIAGGIYIMRIKVPRYLRKQIPSQININKGITNPIPPVYLYSGDIDDDNNLNVLDFNKLRDCYSETQPPSACPDAGQKTAADINSDGAVNQIDYNLFLREAFKSNLN